MRVPQFEDLAKRLAGKVSFFFVYSREAHANASGSAPINRVADGLRAMDADGDGATTIQEFEGPRVMFDAFDINSDERLVAHEFLVARRVEEFHEFAEPETDGDRMLAATRFREEMPGEIPVIVDTVDNATSLAYGGLPNSAFVIARGGKIRAKQAWAGVRGIEPVLAELLGEPVPQPRALPPNWESIGASLARAQAANRRLLVSFSAPGCIACSRMDSTTLIDPGVRVLLADIELAKLDISADAAWSLFEALEFEGTPAAVMLSPDGTVLGRAEGYQDIATFTAFLQKPRGPQESPAAALN